MLRELREYYQQVGIAAEGFACPHAEGCRSVCVDFVTAREAFVGSAYEAGGVPRVLFLSLDAGSTEPGREPHMRTLAYVRYWEEDCCRPECLRKNTHWYWTHRLAFDILNAHAEARGGDRITLDDVHRYFAHTNSAKCKDAARGTRQGKPAMFRNCREFIPHEVEILRPDVIITQGKYAREAVDGVFGVVGCCVHRADCDEYHCEVLTLSSRPVLKVSTAHQGRRGEFWREMRNAYPWYVEMAKQFLADPEDFIRKRGARR